jgi:hypothetical protein
MLQQNSEQPLAQMLAIPLKLELCKQTRANTKRYQWPSVVIAGTTILEVCDFKWRPLGSVTVKIKIVNIGIGLVIVETE